MITTKQRTMAPVRPPDLQAGRVGLDHGGVTDLAWVGARPPGRPIDGQRVLDCHGAAAGSTPPAEGRPAMHELSLCISVVDLVAAAARRENVARVTRVVLEVGVAATVDPEALRFAFPLAAAGGALDGAELTIEPIALQLRCAACGTEYGAGSLAAAVCPACGGHAREVLRGRELRVVSFDAGAPGSPERPDP